jgi:hypothetical protein
MSSLAAVVDTLQEQNRSMETVKDGILTLVKESENARIAYERGAGDRAEAAREKRKEKAARVSTPNSFTGGVKQGLGLTALADMAGNLFGGMLGGGLAASIGVLAGRILKKGAIAGLAAVFLGDAIEKALSSFGFNLTDEQQSDVNEKATSALYAYMIASFATKNPYVKVLAAIGGAFGSEITGWLSRTFGWNKETGKVKLPGVGELDTLNPNVQTAIGSITAALAGLVVYTANRIRRYIKSQRPAIDSVLPKEEPTLRGPSPQTGLEDATKRPFLGGNQRVNTPVGSPPKAKYEPLIATRVPTQTLIDNAADAVKKSSNVIDFEQAKRQFAGDPRVANDIIAPKPQRAPLVATRTAVTDMVDGIKAAVDRDTASTVQKVLDAAEPIGKVASKALIPLEAFFIARDVALDKEMLEASGVVKTTMNRIAREPANIVDFFANTLMDANKELLLDPLNEMAKLVTGKEIFTNHARLNLNQMQRDLQMANIEAENAYYDGLLVNNGGRNKARLTAAGPSEATDTLTSYEPGQQRRGSSAPVIINEGDNITNNNVSGGGPPKPAPRSAVDSVATTKELVSGGRRGYRPGG